MGLLADLPQPGGLPGRGTGPDCPCNPDQPCGEQRDKPGWLRNRDLIAPNVRVTTLPQFIYLDKYT